jgi:hypothetical protein
MSDAQNDKWRRRIHFPAWADQLATGIWSAAEKAGRKLVIAWFLKHCKVEHRVVCMAEARAFLEAQLGRRHPAPAVEAQWRESLRWFCRGGASRGRGTAATADAGRPPMAARRSALVGPA